ncbi:MAG: flagellar basal-body rod protein FlgF [Rickettsiales bacterium]|nr:flagellar basal-body rod protein FlgF [Rickettsiales bacterium]
MDNSVYVALSRQMTLFRDMDVTANNIANADTTGYQTEKTMFTDYLVDDGNREDIAFSQDIATYHDLRQGSMNVTGNDLDVAVMGEGYFVVETAAGERYTRAGNFQMDAEGTLVTADGFPVVDDAGQRIQFEAEDRDIRIGENGALFVDGQERATLGLVEFPNRQDLKRMNSTLFESDVPPALAQKSRVLHGTLEKSNVQPVTELVRLTELSRSTGSTAKFIEVMYDLQRKSSQTWTAQS